LWFNVDGRIREEVSGGGEEGAEGCREAVADEVVGGNFVDASAVEDVIAVRVVVLSTRAEGFVG